MAVATRYKGSTGVQMSTVRYEQVWGETNVAGAVAGLCALCPLSLSPHPPYHHFIFYFSLLFKYFYMHVILYLDYFNEK